MSMFRVGDFEVDLRAGELRKRGRTTRLQDKPLQLFGLLLENANTLVTREQIIECLWGASRYHDFADSLNQSVRKLRQALRDNASNPRILETVPRRGYRLIAPVERIVPLVPAELATVAGSLSSNAVCSIRGQPQLGRLPAAIEKAAQGPCFIGRDTELRSLGAAWDAGRRLRQQLVLITGEPGIGKTRLAFEFARFVSREGTVLVGRCDTEALVPYAPFIEILDWLLQICPAPTLREWLASIDGSIELAQLVPEIAAQLHATSEAVPSTAEGRRYRMFEAFTRLLHSASRSRPILLVLEDMHWADRGSMLLLRHLVRSPREAAICTVVTFCDPELQRTQSSGEILADLRHEPSATRVVLGALSEDHIRRFVDRWTGESAAPHLIRFVAESTQGNPLFMTEVLRHLSETDAMKRLVTLGTTATLADFGVPDSVRELIARRLSRLSETCKRLLTLASVIGREFNLSVVEPLAQLPEHAVLDGMDEAVAARIIQEVAPPGRFSFTHPIIRETLYSQQTAARRVRLHHSVAETIERQTEPGRVPLAELAYHFGHGAVFGDAVKAVDYAIRAAEYATAGVALEDAARYYGLALHALEFLPHDSNIHEKRLELHALRGRSYFQVGQWASAKGEFEAALSILEARQGTEVKRCELLVSLAETSFWLMNVAGVRHFASEAHRLGDRIGRDDLSSDALAWLASAQAAEGDVLGAIEMDRRALARGGGSRSFGRARVPLTLYWAGRTTDAVDQAAQAVECARESQDPAFLLYALQHSGLSLSGAGRYDEAIRVFDEACTLGRRCGALPLLARAISMSVAPFLSLGDLEGARMRALEARELAHRVAFEPPLVSAGIDLLLISARSQDAGSTEALFHEIALATEKASGWHGWKWRLRLSQAKAELALARGNWSEAIVAAGHVVEQSRARSRVKYEALGLATRARALNRLGSGQAVDDAQAAIIVARRLADPAVLLECLGVLLELEGSDELLAEAQLTVRRISGALSEEPLRRRFLAAASSKLGSTLGDQLVLV